ncbi:MAG TPA: methylenetetrahydrofolate reductase [Candidatus Binataceae bacterium]|nr:methylenetetrahydrofolate reductase [Candidatus Binataceae bacterium]
MALKFPALWIEVSPPRGIVSAPMLERLGDLRGLVSAINLTDNALALVKMSALAFAAMIKHRLGMPVVLNMTCRDRNLLALKADLLGAAALGVDAVVALSGDRRGAGEFCGVHEVDGVGLLGVIEALNRGDTGEGKTLLQRAPALLAGAVVNPNRKNWERELELLERKVAAGARFAITQPVFDVERAMNFLDAVRGLPLRIVMGILPIKGAAMARYLKERIRDLRGLHAYLDRYAAMSDGQARSYSLSQSLELMEALRGRVAGFNIMSGGGPSLAIELARLFTRESTWQADSRPVAGC